MRDGMRPDETLQDGNFTIENRSVASSILAPGTIVFKGLGDDPQVQCGRCVSFAGLSL